MPVLRPMQPLHEGFLPEQDGHTIYFATYGNPTGPTVVSLHGGPGSHSKTEHTQRFDLTNYRVVLFDQRGCGKSLPLGEVKENTTQKLIADIERLREAVGVEKWFVSGGSWGSTLALAYGEVHPDRVRGLLLSGVWTASAAEMSWSYYGEGGVERLFPDAWEARMQFFARYGVTPKNAAEKLLPLMMNGDLATQQDIAAGVANWEMNLFSTQSDVHYAEPSEMTEEDIAGTKIFLHYEKNHFFFDEGQILRDVEMIRHIPTVLLHGRYDVVCPLDACWALQKKLDNVKLVIAPSSGHKLTAEGEALRKMAFTQALTDWCTLERKMVVNTQ